MNDRSCLINDMKANAVIRAQSTDVLYTRGLTLTIGDTDKNSGDGEYSFF